MPKIDLTRRPAQSRTLAGGPQPKFRAPAPPRQSTGGTAAPPASLPFGAISMPKTGPQPKYRAPAPPRQGAGGAASPPASLPLGALSMPKAGPPKYRAPTPPTGGAGAPPSGTAAPWQRGQRPTGPARQAAASRGIVKPALMNMNVAPSEWYLAKDLPLMNMNVAPTAPRSAGAQPRPGDADYIPPPSTPPPGSQPKPGDANYIPPPSTPPPGTPVPSGMLDLGDAMEVTGHIAAPVHAMALKIKDVTPQDPKLDPNTEVDAKGRVGGVETAENMLELSGAVTGVISSSATGNTADSAGIAGAAEEGVQALWSIVKLVIKLVKHVRARNKMTQEEKDLAKEAENIVGSSGSEASDTVESIFNAITSVASFINTSFQLTLAAVDKIPLVGAIIGSLAAGMSCAINLVKLSRAKTGLNHARSMKEEAKKDILGLQDGSGQYVSIRSQKGDRLNLFGKGAHFDGTGFGTTMDAKLNKERNKRLDEHVAEERAGLSGMTDEKARAKKEEMLWQLESYDMGKEMSSMQKKRMRGSLISIAFKDVINFAASVASLDPTGELAGGIAKTVVTGGFMAKDSIAEARRSGRNKGKAHFNMNKSDFNKKARRRNLAATAFLHIKKLNDYNFEAERMKHGARRESQARISELKRGNREYKNMEDFVLAMGGPTVNSLYQASAGPQPDQKWEAMVDIMTNALYASAG